ncbi:hypothetical protein CTA2_10301 [Colletotrichum tanaceti]|uniref:Ribosomal protein s17 n=1 Tax=Colletotrichum tanaceti TaxID=1306861 RepID=A0A4U6X6W6_9PEZI|nr:hypothetical protein CTA2_10301 [Colletotrichum tanaceti]TKW49177.1 hypothetical protein CTA1_10592 [Colletotrichum tanaceti]
MIYPLALTTILATVTLTHGFILPGSSSADRGFRYGVLRRQTGSSCLNSNVIQKASSLTGQEAGTEGIKAGQAKSDTDPNNFINFCEGQTLTNGKQITAGSCSGVPQGKIPAQKNMISAMITNPQPGTTVEAGKTFNVSVQTAHLKAGFFVNPSTNYYSAPQNLDSTTGDIIGHCHVTIQEIGSLKSTTPPDPTKFAFFKGIDTDGNGKGLLQASVDGGLPAGAYRVCTMIAAANHQPVIMPVAQRGAQDDCTKFEVTGGGTKGIGEGTNGDGDLTKGAAGGKDTGGGANGVGGGTKETNGAAKGGGAAKTGGGNAKAGGGNAKTGGGGTKGTTKPKKPTDANKKNDKDKKKKKVGAT